MNWLFGKPTIEITRMVGGEKIIGTLNGREFFLTSFTNHKTNYWAWSDTGMRVPGRFADRIDAAALAKIHAEEMREFEYD